MCLALPGRVETVTEAEGERLLGTVSYDGIRQEAELTLVPEAQVGDYVLVHAGFAISILNEEEAQATLQAFNDLERQQ